MNFKIIFTWWNKQTIGTFLKTFFYGQLVGQDESGNKYYKNNQNERWVVYSGSVEATKITSEWFMWMHHTIDKIPSKNDQKYLWQKIHAKNQTGSKNAYRPIKIKKDEKIKKYETWKR